MIKKSAVKTSKKIAFEIKHNSRRVAVVGFKGGRGVITTSVTHVKGEEGRDDPPRLYIGGLDTESNEHVRWIHKSLRMGDEVIIRVIESEKITRIKERHKQDQPKKRNIAWIRELAKKYGYKLVKRT